MTWEYLAGFFDGEGCIFFNKRPYSYGRYVGVSVTQGVVNEARGNVLHEIVAFLNDRGIGARIIRISRDNADDQWKVVTNAAGNCRRWLEGMLPYLRVKRQQALDAIEFINSLPGRRGRPLRKVA